MNVLKLIKSDYQKYQKYGGNFISILFFTQGFWAIFQYRVANLAYRTLHIPVFRQVCLVGLLIWQKGIEIISGISIPASVQIGHSFYIGHFGSVILNANTVIGDNCNISQGVTIGVSGLDRNRGVPKIGDNVYIGANTVVAGNIKISNNVLIGACSLVTEDASESAVLLGVPAIKISNKGSKGYI
ncbi:serine O-acetyltransferase [Lutibacter holmesii]|uniref:Serine acetyltransferase n=1 Tax=Lutibacter holmesii TaxID=1137985 RepID=A0ABW3WSK9_9FLAO